MSDKILKLDQAQTLYQDLRGRIDALPTSSDIPEVPVQDVQVDGISILNNGTANIINKVNTTDIGNAGIFNRFFTTIPNGEFTVTVQDEDEYGYFVYITDQNFSIGQGYYRITVNNIEYTLYSYRFIFPSDQWSEFYCYALGNTDLVHEKQENTVLEYNYNVPFCIVDSNQTRLLYTETPGEYAIKIEKQSQNITQLPRELLRTNDNQLVYSRTNGPFNNISIGQNSINPNSKGSIAIGFLNTVEGKNSLSIGVKNSASDGGTTAGGWGNTSSGTYSFATGLMNIASGSMSTVFGSANTASGRRSVVFGSSSTASGTGAFASGQQILAAGDYSFVQGKYNIQDNNQTYAHIIGNGVDNARSNAYALGWDGTGHFAGDVYVGANADSSGGERLAKESELGLKVVRLI